MAKQQSSAFFVLLNYHVTKSLAIRSIFFFVKEKIINNILICAQYLYVILEMYVLIKKLLNHHFLLAAIQHCHTYFMHDDCKLSVINFHCLIYD